MLFGGNWEPAIDQAELDRRRVPVDCASRYLLPAGVRLNVIRAGSGRISRESFAYYDRSTSSWKTCRGCLFEDAEWETYSESFPKWGLMRNGRLYRRAPLVRPISGRGCSLLPTPNATEFGCKDVPRMLERRRECKERTGNGNGFGLTLGQLVAVEQYNLLPTPGASKASNDTSLQCSGDGRKKPNKLGWVAALMSQNHESSGQDAATDSPSHAGGPINPEWLEHLMGFPIGWTELKE
jgi:hypothetical protein